MDADRPRKTSSGGSGTVFAILGGAVALGSVALVVVWVFAYVWHPGWW